MALVDLVPVPSRGGYEDGETEWNAVLSVALKEPKDSNDSELETKLTEALDGELIDLRLAVVTSVSVHDSHLLSKVL